MVIIGDTSGVVGLRLIEFLDAQIALAEANDYEIVILFEPKIHAAAEAMVEADAVVYYGHGYTNGAWELSNGAKGFGYQQIAWILEQRAAKGKGPLDFVAGYSCDSFEMADQWLKVSNTFIGYRGFTFNPAVGNWGYDLSEKHRKPGLGPVKPYRLGGHRSL